MNTNRNPIHATCHPDYLRLEHELCRKIDKLRSRSSIPGILVFATTNRQQQRLRRVLAGRFGGLLGVDVVTHLGFVHRITEPYGMQPLAQVLQETLVEQLATRSQDTLSKYLHEFPTAAESLVRLFEELREHLITPAELRQAAGRKPEQSLAGLFESYEKALSSLASREHDGRPYADRARQTSLAACFVQERPPVQAVFQYGAYELVPMNLELIRAIPSEQPVQWFASVDAAAPAWEYARESVTAVADSVTYLEDADARPLVQTARTFFDWDTDPPPLGEDTLRLLNAQGPESEVETVARQILADLQSHHLDPQDILVVARNLEAFAPELETIFKRLGIPVDSSLKTPLSRTPQSHTFLLLVETLQQNLQRQTVMDLARSPALRIEGEGWTPDWWDTWSRQARLVCGESAWLDLASAMRTLEKESGKDSPLHRSADRLERFIGDLEANRKDWEKARSASDHVAILKSVARQWIHQDPEDILNALDELETLELATSVLGSGKRRLNPRTVLQYVKRILRERELSWSDAGGVQLLDVMQARGLTYRKTYWIGFNADWLPARANENPFLGHAARSRLRQETGRRIKVHQDSILEERLLLAQTAVSATDRLQISWQRADAEGRSMAPSLYLDQWRRAINEDDHRVPTHPKAFAEWQQEETGLLDASEGALLSAWGCRQTRSTVLRAFIETIEAPQVAPNLDMVAAVDQAHGTDLSYDSMISATGTWTDSFSPSSLEAMGKCPHTFYYSRVLGIRPLREEAKDSGVDTLDVGLLVHEVLERLYPELTTKAKMPALLQSTFDSVFTHVRQRMNSRYPVAWKTFRAGWLRELEAFLTKDMERFDSEGWSFAHAEQALERNLSLPNEDNPYFTDPTTFVLKGKLDRVAVNASGDLLVSDYKTSGNLKKHTEHAVYLKGRRLQLPLYELLAAPEQGSIAVELLGIGPKFHPDRGYLHTGPTVNKDNFSWDGLKETLATLIELAREGRFPFNQDDEHCRYCNFVSACRKSHVPTVMRLENSEPLEAFHAIQKKGVHQPTFAVIRKKEGGA